MVVVVLFELMIVEGMAQGNAKQCVQRKTLYALEDVVVL